MTKLAKLVMKQQDSVRELVEAVKEASKKEGRKEVVEWVQVNGGLGVTVYAISVDEWQAKLKEWGLLE